VGGEVQDAVVRGLGLEQVLTRIHPQVGEAALRPVLRGDQPDLPLRFGKRGQDRGGASDLGPEIGPAHGEQGGETVAGRHFPVERLPQDGQGRRVGNGGGFDHVPSARVLQRLEGNLPQGPVGNHHELRSVPDRRESGEEELIVEPARVLSEREVAPGELIAEPVGQGRQRRPVQGQGRGLESEPALGERQDEKVALLFGNDVFQDRRRRARQQPLGLAEREGPNGPLPCARLRLPQVNRSLELLVGGAARAALFLQRREARGIRRILEAFGLELLIQRGERRPPAGIFGPDLARRNG
jgi:hypothetical protein